MSKQSVVPPGTGSVLYDVTIEEQLSNPADESAKA
jgi:hypothetical protein